MSSHMHKMVVDVPIKTVWDFVCSIDHWAPLVPGYIEHEIINETESTWKFKTDFGIVKKKIHLKVVITKWDVTEKITFNLTGINEKFEGNGYFEVEKLEDHKTRMMGFIDIHASGTLAKMMNPKLKTVIPELTEDLTKAVAKKLEEIAETRK